MTKTRRGRKIFAPRTWRQQSPSIPTSSNPAPKDLSHDEESSRDAQSNIDRAVRDRRSSSLEENETKSKQSFYLRDSSGEENRYAEGSGLHRENIHYHGIESGIGEGSRRRVPSVEDSMVMDIMSGSQREIHGLSQSHELKQRPRPKVSPSVESEFAGDMYPPTQSTHRRKTNRRRSRSRSGSTPSSSEEYTSDSESMSPRGRDGYNFRRRRGGTRSRSRSASMAPSIRRLSTSRKILIVPPIPRFRSSRLRVDGDTPSTESTNSRSSRITQSISRSSTSASTMRSRSVSTISSVEDSPLEGNELENPPDIPQTANRSVETGKDETNNPASKIPLDPLGFSGHGGQINNTTREEMPTLKGSWDTLMKEIETHDEDMVKGYEDDIDTLLVFAGLFSAVVTAFIIESYKLLQKDPADSTVELLTRISLQLGNVADPLPLDPPTFSPTPSAVRINTFWFTSLVVTLVDALFSLLCKQWLREHRRHVNTHTPDAAFTLRWLRNQSFENWHVRRILASLPALLELALFFFFAGLLELLWTTHHVPFAIAMGVVAFGLLVYIITTFLPVIMIGMMFRHAAELVQNKVDLKAPPWVRPGGSRELDIIKNGLATIQFLCPFKSPQSWAVFKLTFVLFQTFWRGLLWALNGFPTSRGYNIMHLFGPVVWILRVMLVLFRVVTWILYPLRWYLHHTKWIIEPIIPLSPPLFRYLLQGFRWLLNIVVRPLRFLISLLIARPLRLVVLHFIRMGVAMGWLPNALGKSTNDKIHYLSLLNAELPDMYKLLDWSSVDLTVMQRSSPYPGISNVYELKGLRWLVEQFRDSASMTLHLENVLVHSKYDASIVMPSVFDYWFYMPGLDYGASTISNELQQPDVNHHSFLSDPSKQNNSSLFFRLLSLHHLISEAQGRNMDPSFVEVAEILWRDIISDPRNVGRTGFPIPLRVNRSLGVRSLKFYDRRVLELYQECWDKVAYSFRKDLVEAISKYMRRKKKLFLSPTSPLNDPRLQFLIFINDNLVSDFQFRYAGDTILSWLDALNHQKLIPSKEFKYIPGYFTAYMARLDELLTSPSVSFLELLLDLAEENWYHISDSETLKMVSALTHIIETLLGQPANSSGPPRSTASPGMSKSILLHLKSINRKIGNTTLIHTAEEIVTGWNKALELVTDSNGLSSRYFKPIKPRSRRRRSTFARYGTQTTGDESSTEGPSMLRNASSRLPTAARKVMKMQNVISASGHRPNAEQGPEGEREAHPDSPEGKSEVANSDEEADKRKDDNSERQDQDTGRMGGPGADNKV